MKYIPKLDKNGQFMPVIINRNKLCKLCGKEFTPSVKNFARAKFCSDSCASKSHPSGRTGKTNSQYQKNMVSLKCSDEKHHCWKGNDVSNGALHAWARRNIEKPKKCKICGETGKYIYRKNGTKRWSIDLANKNHKYKRNLTDWIPMCQKCHGEHDHKLGLRKHRP